MSASPVLLQLLCVSKETMFFLRNEQNFIWWQFCLLISVGFFFSWTETCNTPAKTEQERQQGGEGTGNDNSKSMSVEDTMKYHNIGDKLLVKHYSTFITQDEKKNKFDGWLKYK